MRTVALVGFSKRSNQAAYNLPPDVELWTLNQGHMHGFPHIERLFDMHQWEFINDIHYFPDKKRGYHLEFLKAHHDYPIYMLEAYPDVPSVVRYPIEKALLLAGKYRKFTSSLCYMIAAALLEDVDRIEIYGFDMDEGTEYSYQREDAWKWIEYAEGLGIVVYIDPGSGLLVKRMMYGYEGLPMINRMTIEVHIKQYQREQEKSLEMLHNWEGILYERKRLSMSNRQIKEATEMVQGFMRQAAMNEGAVKAMQYLLDTSDLKEIEPLLIDQRVAELAGATEG